MVFTQLFRVDGPVAFFGDGPLNEGPPPPQTPTANRPT
jgi:hypothetical protein